MLRILRWGGLFSLAIAALVLIVMWDRVPEVWTVHWGVGMRPDGWAHKSARSASVPLWIGLGLWLLQELLAAVTARRTRIPALGRASAAVMRALGCFAATLLAVSAIWLPLAPALHPEWLVIGSVAAISCAIALFALYLSRVTRRLKEGGEPGLEGYHGVVYFNREDARLWVPKIGGLGYTINFAHPAAWPMLALLLLPAGVLVTLLLVRR